MSHGNPSCTTGGVQGSPRSTRPYLPPGQQTRPRPTGRSRECPLRRSHRHRVRVPLHDLPQSPQSRGPGLSGLRRQPLPGRRRRKGTCSWEAARRAARQPDPVLCSIRASCTLYIPWLCNPAKYPGKGNPSGRACFPGCHPDLLQAHDYLFWFTCLWVYFFCIMSAGVVVVEKGREVPLSCDKGQPHGITCRRTGRGHKNPAFPPAIGPRPAPLRQHRKGCAPKSTFFVRLYVQNQDGMCKINNFIDYF